MMTAKEKAKFKALETNLQRAQEEIVELQKLNRQQFSTITELQRAKAEKEHAKLMESSMLAFRTDNQCIPVTGVAATLVDRGARYGKFEDHARCAQAIQRAMEQFQKPSTLVGELSSIQNPWQDLPSIMQRALTTIADKIARVLNGDCMYDDNWHDIQGYAKLVEDWIKEQKSVNCEGVPGQATSDR